MLELLAAASLLFAVAAIAATLFALTYRSERDEALQDLTIARADVRSLTKRCTDLRAEVITRERSIDTLRAGHDRLVDERDDLKRKLGCIEAERRAEKMALPCDEKMALPCEQKPGTITVPVNRDPATGRFARQPQPAKPIACG